MGLALRRRTLSSFEMVVKTDLCNYSGFRIYPGHGKKFVRSDQKMFTFITAKSERCFKMKRRNLTTKWTVQYRHINKKGSVEETEKKRRSKKSLVKTREIVGLTAEMLEKKRSARPQAKDKQRDAALKELKSRKGAKKGAGKK